MAASAGQLRYRILPSVAENEEDSLLTAEVWEGPWAYEFSTVEETRTFPLSEEGLTALPLWLTEWADEDGSVMNGLYAIGTDSMGVLFTNTSSPSRLPEQPFPGP